MAAAAAFKDPNPAAAEAAVVSAGLVDALQWLQVSNKTHLLVWVWTV